MKIAGLTYQGKIDYSEYLGTSLTFGCDDVTATIYGYKKDYDFISKDIVIDEFFQSSNEIVDFWTNVQLNEMWIDSNKFLVASYMLDDVALSYLYLTVINNNFLKIRYSIYGNWDESSIDKKDEFVKSLMQEINQ